MELLGRFRLQVVFGSAEERAESRTRRDERADFFLSFFFGCVSVDVWDISG